MNNYTKSEFDSNELLNSKQILFMAAFKEGYFILKKNKVLDNVKPIDFLNHFLKSSSSRFEIESIKIPKFRASYKIKISKEIFENHLFLEGFLSGILSKYYEECVILKVEDKYTNSLDEFFLLVNTNSIDDWGNFLPYFHYNFFEEMFTSTCEQEVQYDSLFKITEYQKMLNSFLLENSTIQSLCEKIFEYTKLPILTKDSSMNTINSAGFEEGFLKKLDNSLEEEIRNNTFNNVFNSNLKDIIRVINVLDREFLVKQINLKGDVIGWAFIGTNIELYKFGTLAVKFYLDLFTETITLKLNTDKNIQILLEQLKESLFESLLSMNLPEPELHKKGLFVKINLYNPYYILILNYHKSSNTKINEEILTKKVDDFFKLKNKATLVGIFKGRISLLYPIKNHEKDMPLLEGLLKELELTLPNVTFKINVSAIKKAPKDASIGWDEANIISNLSSQDRICYFSKNNSLIFLKLHESEFSTLDNTCKEVLKELYINASLKKERILLQTLYVFLSNDKNLNITSSELNLSISGLRRRLTQIEEILDIDLRSPKKTQEILLLIQLLIVNSLIVIDEL